MREILFKAKRTDSDTWIEGNLRNVRINRLGWSPEKAFTTKPQERKETKKNEAALL